MSVDQIVDRLGVVAKRQATQLGWEFSPDCLNIHLMPFISEGVAQMGQSGQLADKLFVALAEANIVMFVTRMAIEARERGLNRLGERSFFSVRAVICPLFPFC